jgi:hypothetical protein|tara:strand:+ start:564 stop:1802 length:1239 start_codon:yes stop_codon:yes gene_type:complete
MANELDKTIEELEAEVLGELEEANGQDAPMKSAAPADKIDTSKSDYEDTGKAVVDPEQKDSPAKKIAAKAKEVGGDAQQKGEGKPDKMAKIKEDADGDESDEDESSAEEMPKTKMEYMTAMKDMMADMGKMKKDQLMATYDMMKNAMHEKEESDEDKAKSEAVEARMKSIDVAEHVEALLNGEGDLSEEFKTKAATVFEAAVKSKVRSEVERMEEEYTTELEGNINATKEELTEKVDTYLNYVVEEWMKENELAVERGLKGEIAEDFISGLKQLFEDHYVDVPDEKYDVLEAQSEKISELEGKINEMMEASITLKSNNAELVKEQVMSEVSSDLAETEIEKFKSLIEDVDYSNEASYREKLSTLKESYFPKSVTVVTETIDDVQTGQAQDVDSSGSMAAYMSAIGRTVNSAK